MRINVYGQEITDEVLHIEKVSNTGIIIGEIMKVKSLAQRFFECESFRNEQNKMWHSTGHSRNLTVLEMWNIAVQTEFVYTNI